MIKLFFILFLISFNKDCFADISNQSIEYKTLSENFDISQDYYYFSFDDFSNFKNQDFIISNNQAIIVNQIKNKTYSDIATNEKFTNLYEFKISPQNLHNEDELIFIFKKHYSQNWLFFSSEKAFNNRVTFFQYFIKNYLLNHYDEKFISHHKFNYKLNGWVVQKPKNTLIKNYHYLYYVPQFYFELGIFLSSILATLMLLFLVIYLVRWTITKKNV